MSESFAVLPTKPFFLRGFLRILKLYGTVTQMLSTFRAKRYWTTVREQVWIADSQKLPRFHSCINHYLYRRTVGNQTLARFSGTYPGSCWVVAGEHLFTSSLSLSVENHPLPKTKDELFKQNKLCSDLCHWCIIVVMIPAKCIPSVCFITSNLKVLSCGYMESTGPKSALGYLGVPSVWHSEHHWCAWDTQRAQIDAWILPLLIARYCWFLERPLSFENRACESQTIL